MKNKVLITVYVPCIDEEYELYIPTNESIKKVLDLIVKSIYDLSDSNLNINIPHFLIDPTTLVKYTQNSIIRDTNIINSKKIVLI